MHLDISSSVQLSISKSGICGHSDTLATLTLLPGPEGVTVGGDICTEYICNMAPKGTSH